MPARRSRCPWVVAVARLSELLLAEDCGDPRVKVGVHLDRESSLLRGLRNRPQVDRGRSPERFVARVRCGVVPLQPHASSGERQTVWTSYQARAMEIDGLS